MAPITYESRTKAAGSQFGLESSQPGQYDVPNKYVYRDTNWK